MTDPATGSTRRRLRLSSAIVLGVLCAAAVLFALDPAARAGATALPPAVAPLSESGAPQTVLADDGALQAAGLITATHSAISATGPIHYGAITALPVGSSSRGSAAGSGPDAGDPGRLAPQSGGVKYDNLSTPTNFYVPGAPAAATGAFSSSLLMADNITLSEVVDGLRVTQFVVAIYNANPGSVSAEVNFSFWYDDGPSGGPGTYFKNASGALVGYYYPSYALASGLNLVSVNVPDAGFTFPAGRKTFWAGVAVDNQGLPGTTAAQLDQIGQAMYDPPVVGSSTDTLFKSSTAGSKFAVNNPSGSQLNFGGSPVANLGWRFTFDNSCPTVVTTIVDSVAGSLRSALACATPGDTITFTLPANSVIALTGVQLTVTKAITIDGSTAVNLAVSGNNTSRVFSITAPVNVVSLTVMNGNAGVGNGGGLNSTSALTMTNVKVISNTANTGGGLYANSTLALTNTVFISNVTQGGPGGGAFAFGAATLSGGLFQYNQSPSASGGGMDANTTLVLTGTQFLSNTAQFFGGGLWVLGASTLDHALFQNNRNTNSSGTGGGLSASAKAVLTETSFISNTAAGIGGGSYVGGAATLSGGLFQLNVSTNGGGGGLRVNGALTLSGTQFLSNTASTGGGAYALGAATVSEGLFQNNHATNLGGGGLFVNSTLALTNTQFLSNTAAINGGGALAVSAATLSGGLFMNNSSPNGEGGGFLANVTLALTGTQFISNAAAFKGGGAYAQDAATLNNGLFQNNHSTGDKGGGLYASGTLALTGTNFLSNTALVEGAGALVVGAATLNGGLFQNNLSTGSSGGGLYVTGTLALLDTQFISNSASNQGGGAYANGAATLSGGLFQYNQSTNRGGGLFAGDALALTGTNFLSNTAGTEGGGLFANGTLAMTGTQFVSNTAQYDGGGLQVVGAATLEHALFQNNRTTTFLGAGGGGLYAQSTLALTNTQFLSNTSAGSGGGLHTNSSLALTGTQFISNTAASSGGGAYVQGAATLSGGLFQNNSSTTGQGGGLSVHNALTLTGTSFLSNTASNGGGGANAGGATTLLEGLFQNNSSPNGAGGGLNANSTLALTGTQFISNSAGIQGGGAYVNSAATLSGGQFMSNTANIQGGGLFAASTLALTGTQFISNTAAVNGGGAVAVGVTLNGGLFQNNSCTRSGCPGGGLLAGGPLAMTGTQFISNTAASGGGVYLTCCGADARVVNGLFARNVATDTLGAALYLNSAGTVEILHTTIASPTLASGSAIYIAAGTVGITDTIVASYTTGISNVGGTVNEDYNLFFGDTISQTGTINGGTHDVLGDPRFVNPASDDYHLRVGSAAVDRGTDAGVYSDLDGVVRPQGGGFDIGAYEAILRRLFLPLILR